MSDWRDRAANAIADRFAAMFDRAVELEMKEAPNAKEREIIGGALLRVRLRIFGDVGPCPKHIVMRHARDGRPLAPRLQLTKGEREHEYALAEAVFNERADASNGDLFTAYRQRGGVLKLGSVAHIWAGARHERKLAAGDPDAIEKQKRSDAAAAIFESYRRSR